MAPSVSLGRSSSLLQQPELEAAVCRALSCDLSAVQSLDLGQQHSGSVADGFLSTCGSVEVDAVVRGRPHKLHLFVKREDAKDVATGMHCFKREGLFYGGIHPQLERAWRRADKEGAEPASPDLGPAAYLGTDNLVVMEDLTRRGYGAVEEWLWNGLDIGAVQQTLRALARLHAASVVAERCDGAALSPDLLNEHFVTRRPGTVGRRLFDTAAAVICDVLLPDMFKSLKVPQTDAELRRLQDETRDSFAKMDMDAVRRAEKEHGGLIVVTHGDAWPNNVLIKRDSQGNAEHAVLVDFQMVRLAPPAFDVVMYLFVSTRRAFRRQHMDNLLRGYYGDLVAFCSQRGLDISKEFSWEHFMSSAGRLRSLCATVGLAYIQLLAGNEKDMRELFTDGESRARFLLDRSVRGALVERWFKAEERYRQILTEYAEDFLQLAPSQE